MPPVARIVLGIESSCDETSAAVLVEGRLRSNVIASQVAEHRPFGGVVPELASRAHQSRIVPVVAQALTEAGIGKRDLTAVAVTQGPGLVGALLVGVQFAKGLSLGLGIPLVGVHHIEAHVWANALSDPAPEPPFVCLVVSGGHTQLMHVAADLTMTVLGATRDDAAGEAFDKVAKLLGLGYPGGAALDRLAAEGDPTFVRFPRPHLPETPLAFSFSGLKTAMLHHLKAHPDPAYLAAHRADLAASFQAAVVEVLVTKLVRAARVCGVKQVALAGGVAANRGLRAALKAAAAKLEVFIPAPVLCTDNAAMIAAAGFARLSQDPLSDPVTIEAVASWPLPISVAT